MTTPEHDTDGTYIARQQPVEVPTALYPGDENDRLPGETEGDREIRLRQLGYGPNGERLTPAEAPEGDEASGRDLAAQWAEEHPDEAPEGGA